MLSNGGRMTKFKKYALILILLVGLAGRNLVADTLYSSSTINTLEDGVSLSKNAQWTGVKNEGVVSLQFTGIDKVMGVAKPVDIIFTLDTSGSMAEAGGIVNPNRKIFSGYGNRTKLNIKSVNYAYFKNLVLPYVESGQIEIDADLDTVTPSQTFGVNIDPNIQISIPKEDYAILFSTYTEENPDLYLVPRIFKSQDGSMNKTLFSADSTKTWMVVDFNNPTPFTTTFNEGYFDIPTYAYQIDQDNNRVSVPLSSNKQEYYNFPYYPTYNYKLPGETPMLYNLDGFEALYDEDGVPTSWSQAKFIDGKWEGDTQRVHLLSTAVKEFSDGVFELSDESRYGFASFNTKARGTTNVGEIIESQNYGNITTNKEEFIDEVIDSIKYTGQQVPVPESYKLDVVNGALRPVLINANSVGTNYAAGLLSMMGVINEDTEEGKTNEHQKVVIFISDGAPTFELMSQNLPFDQNGNSPVMQLDNRDLDPTNADKPYHVTNISLDQVKRKMNQDYPEYKIYGIALQEKDEANLKSHLSFLTDPEKVYSLNVENIPELESTFSDIVKKIVEDITLETKIVEMEDVIDNRFFKVDTAKLLANENEVFYPEDVTEITVVDDIVDGVPVQRVKFEFTFENPTYNSQEVSIPVLLQSDIDADEMEGYVPTNYDTSLKDGASGKYINLDGEATSIDTSKVWLPTVAAMITKVDSEDSEILLHGAEFRLYYPDGELVNNTIYRTNGLGEVVIESLAPGNYELQEIKAPNRYDLLHDNIKLKLLGEGNIITIPTQYSYTVPNKMMDDVEDIYSLRVEKEVIGGDDNVEFEFEVEFDSVETIEYVDGVDVITFVGSETFYLKDGEYIVFNNIPKNTDFMVSEVETENYVVDKEGWKEEGTIESEHKTIKFVNTFITKEETEDLTFYKSASGGDVESIFRFRVIIDSEQTYNYEYDGINENITGEKVIEIKRGESVTIENIPLGTEYSIEEITHPEYLVTQPNGGIYEGKIEEDMIPLAFTNVYKESTVDTYSLFLIKDVKGIDTDFAFEFDVQFSGTDEIKYIYNGVEYSIAGQGKISLKHGESIEFIGLPEGTTYKIQEKDMDGYIVYPTNGLVEGTITQNITHIYENTYDNPERETAVLNVHKKVVGNSATESFNFTAVFSTDEEIKYFKNGKEYTLNEMGDFTLKHGERVQFINIPLGTKYEVYEDENDDYTVTPSSGKIEGILEETSSIEFTNTFINIEDELYTLKLKKEVIGRYEGEIFKFDVQFEDLSSPIEYIKGNEIFELDETNLVDLLDGEEIEFINIPQGTRYEVKEVMDTSYIASPNGGVVKGVLISDDEVIITNIRIENEVFTLKVNKVVEGIKTQEKFKFKAHFENVVDIQYIKDGKIVTLSKEGIFELSHNEEIIFINIPAGTAYKIEELEHKAYIRTYNGNTVDDLKEDTAIEVINTRKDNSGGETIDPEVDKPGIDIDDGNKGKLPQTGYSSYLPNVSLVLILLGIVVIVICEQKINRTKDK